MFIILPESNTEQLVSLWAVQIRISFVNTSSVSFQAETFGNVISLCLHYKFPRVHFFPFFVCFDYLVHFFLIVYYVFFTA